MGKVISLQQYCHGMHKQEVHTGAPACSGHSWDADFQGPLEDFHKSWMVKSLREQQKSQACI